MIICEKHGPCTSADSVRPEHWIKIFSYRTPQLDPITEGTRTKINILGTGYAVRGSRRADLGQLAADRQRIGSGAAADRQRIGGGGGAAVGLLDGGRYV